MKRRFLFLAVVCGMAVPLPIGIGLAHDGATGVVKERMDLMSAIGKDTKYLVGIARGKFSYDAERVEEIARGIEDRAGDKMTDLFPPNSIMPPSESLPEIWQDFEAFSKIAHDLRDAAASVAAETQSADRVREDLIPRLVNTCKACHDKFRLED